jgi:hypothetical protein
MIDVRARNNSGARNGLRFLLRSLGALLAVLFITSCGNNIFVVGTPIVTFTAQPGHFTSYIVTIDEIEMTRKDGTVIELPTVSERVDLANLSNFVQLLELPAVGVGTYVSATFFLDYSTPYITIDVNGQVMNTTLIDSSTGVAPTVDTITVNFDPNNPLVITTNQSSPVNFNIDLEASNTIDNTDGTTALVTVHPMFTVTARPTYQQPVFSRGLFVFADTNTGGFVMNTRPFHDVLNNPFGALTVIPNEQTYWNINGVAMTGSAGLTALAALQSQTASLQIGVVSTPGQNMFGNTNTIQPSMTAAQIYVGTSLESTIQDHVTGIVASRANNTIQVLGAALVDRLGTYGFTQTIPVTIANTTAASVDGVGSTTLDAVSVGQFIDVSGQVVENTDGSGNPVSLDATLGQIRLQPTSLWGVLNSATTTAANVSLSPVGLVGNYEPSPLVSFAGTGTSSPTNDASYANYIVATPVDESATAPGTLLNIVGLTNNFQQGPPYFTATTVTPASSLPQQLVIVYGGSGSGSPVSAIVDNTIYINLQDPDISQATVNTLGGPATAATPVADLPKPNPALIAIVPATSANQSEYLFTIGSTLNGIDVLSDPTALAARIPAFNALAAITKIVATGTYDGAGNFTATTIEIVGY